jgi:hypothetical protein
VGVVVKHRQLVRQVGVFIEHPSENSMASFSFTGTVLDEGTIFIFGSWICVANGLGGFNSHLADFRKPEASMPTRCSDLDKFVDNFDEFLLLNHVREIETASVFDINCASMQGRFFLAFIFYIRFDLRGLLGSCYKCSR